MPIKIDRKEFLQSLEAVQPGLSPRDIVQQSASFIFKNGRVITFNDEVACRTKSLLPKEFLGAVPAAPLIRALIKLPDEKVDINAEEGHFVIRGKAGRRSRLKMDAEITLPVDTVEKPEQDSWKPLHEDFTDAVGIIQECAGKDESLFALTCLHITPRWVEACDNYQLTRYKIPTGIEKPTLVKRESIKAITSLDMTHFAETPDWLHFRNPNGSVFSCRRFMQDYPSLSEFLKMEEGVPATLPKGLAEAVDRAGNFSMENKDDDQIFIKVKEGLVYVRGVGISGDHFEPLRITYSGPTIEFKISPKLLTEITKRHNEVEINATKLRVHGGKWVYVSSLGDPPDEKKEEPDADED